MSHVSGMGEMPGALVPLQEMQALYFFPPASGCLQATVAVRVMYSAPAEVTSICASIRALSAPLERTSMEQTQALLLIQVFLVLSKTGTLLLC